MTCTGGSGGPRSQHHPHPRKEGALARQALRSPRRRPSRGHHAVLPQVPAGCTYIRPCVCVCVCVCVCIVCVYVCALCVYMCAARSIAAARPAQRMSHSLDLPAIKLIDRVHVCACRSCCRNWRGARISSTAEIPLPKPRRFMFPRTRLR